MTQLKNTLYVTEADASLQLRGTAVEVVNPDGVKTHIPLHLLDAIVSFAYRPASPALMEACAVNGIGYAVFTANGRLRYRVDGPTRGNVELRLRQYAAVGTPEALSIAKGMIGAKAQGEHVLLDRFRRNHPEHGAKLTAVSGALRHQEERIRAAQSPEELRGIEGLCAKLYFGVFDSMILAEDEALRFHGRTRRPPMDCCNALLSFAYTLCTGECINALEQVGLDPYVGFMHGIRPGKPALALDLLEEFRCDTDRFVLRLINLGIVRAEDFERGGDTGVLLNAAGKKKVLREWSLHRQKETRIPGENKPVPAGLLPLLQARALAASLREGIAYTPHKTEE